MSHSPLKEKDVLKMFSSNNQSSIEEMLESENTIRLHTLVNSKNFTGNRLGIIINSLTFHLL